MVDRQTKWLIGAAGLAVTFAGLGLLLGSQFLTPVLTVIFSGAVLAAVVAGIFQTLSDRAATKRATMQIDLQKKLEAIQSMWKIADQQMREHYFPIATAARGLSQIIHLWKKATASPILPIFYWFVRLRIATTVMLKKTTFFILTSYLAEECATALLSSINAASGLSQLELSTLSVSLGPDLTFYGLSNEVQNNDNTRLIFSNFENWLKSEEDGVDKLEKEAEYFHSLITAEINHLYDQWYATTYVPKPGQSLADIAKYLNLP